MGASCILYYITDRKAFANDEETRRRLLLNKIGEACRAGVNYIQLREKDLSTRELEALACDAVRVVGEQSTLATSDRCPATLLLINARTDVGLAAKAGGVHLPADDLSPEDVRTAWRAATAEVSRGSERWAVTPTISVSCHSVPEVMRAAEAGADLVLLGPIFEKKDAPGIRSQGIDALLQAARAKVPVMALGGVTLRNAESCIRAGAAGIAAIRLFQENDMAAVARMLRTI